MMRSIAPEAMAALTQFSLDVRQRHAFFYRVSAASIPNMEKLSSILAVIDPVDEPLQVVTKAIALARYFGAKVEFFLCDAERAHALSHAYDSSGIECARQTCLADGRRYLEGLRHCVLAEDVKISVDVVCESPLYESIVRKVLRSSPDLVIKAATGEHPPRHYMLDTNDWQLARTCPAPLMLIRGRPWASNPRFAAAVDVSAQETIGLACGILQTAEYLSLGCRAELDVLYSDRQADDTEGRERRVALLYELAHKFKVPRDHVHTFQGEPEATLPEFAAREHYDVLVVGALTHRAGLTALVGALTGKLVDSLDCDFVLVKPESYCCPLTEPRQIPTPSGCGERLAAI